MRFLKGVTEVVPWLALFMSLVTFYFQFFSTGHTVVVSSHDLGLSDDNGYHYADIAFANNGDKTITITNVAFCMVSFDVKSYVEAGHWSYVDTEIYHDGNWRFTQLLTEETPSPVIGVPAGEAYVTQIRSTFDYSDSNFMKDKWFNAGVCFQIYTFDGYRFENGIIPFSIQFNDEGRLLHRQRGQHFKEQFRLEIDLK